MSEPCAKCLERRRFAADESGSPAVAELAPIEGPIADQMDWLTRTLHRCERCGTIWEVGHEQHHFRDEELIRLFERDADYARVLYEKEPSAEELKALYARLPEDTDRIRLWTVLTHKAQRDRGFVKALAADGAAPALLRRTAQQLDEAIERGEQ